MLLKVSTARNVPIMLIASSDHISGLASATLTITASKDGGAFASISPTVTDLGSGWYNLTLTTTHTNTKGALALHITATSADPTDVVHEVVTDLPGDTVASVTGAVGSVTGSVGSVTGNVGGSVASVTARVTANADQWAGGTIPAPNVTGVPLIDLKYTLGTISPATAGSVRADAVTGAVGSVTGAVGSVTAGVTVTTNNDKTGYALTSGERTSVADALLDRALATGTDSGGRTVRNALRPLINKVSVPAGTVYKEDDTTAAWTFATTTDAAQSPITVIDPA